MWRLKREGAYLKFRLRGEGRIGSIPEGLDREEGLIELLWYCSK